MGTPWTKEFTAGAEGPQGPPGPGSVLQSTSAVLATDFVIAPENPQTWHTVISKVITTTTGSSLQVFVNATIDDATSGSVSHLARVTIDGTPMPAGRARIVVNGSFTPVVFACMASVSAGSHTVAFQLQNGDAVTSLECLAQSQPDNEGAALLINEVIAS